jgi:hypothetical protein
MQEQKGIAYCGLACVVCSENINCVGCRNEGCTDKEWCKNLQCCKTKGLNGCWECNEFPCKGNMLDKIRIRAFAIFIKEFGIETLLKCLDKNEKAGIVYHYPGKLTGDYDIPKTEERIIDMILNGK